MICGTVYGSQSVKILCCLGFQIGMVKLPFVQKSRELNKNSKVKVSSLQALLSPRGWVEVYLYSSMSDQHHAHAVLNPPSPQKDPVPIVQEAGWAPGPVWMGVKSSPTGIRSPDCPTCSSFAIPTELQYDQYITQTNYVLSYGWQILNTRML